MSDLSINAVELEEVSPAIEPQDQKLVDQGRLDLVSDVKVELAIELGKATVSVKELFELKKNGILTLDSDVDSEVTVLCNSKPVATGRLMVVDNNFGVQITKVI